MTASSRVFDSLFPVTDEMWAVWLRSQNNYSDKEYRIVVDPGTSAAFQWGRTGADGQTKFIGADATAKARSQWSAKERKGYWPMSGVLPVDASYAAALSTKRINVVSVVNEAWHIAVARCDEICAGDELFLVEVPDYGVPRRHVVVDALSEVAGSAASDWVAVAVSAQSVAVLRALVPVCVAVQGDDRDAIAQIAATIAAESSLTSSYERCAFALDVAETIMA